MLDVIAFATFANFSALDSTRLARDRRLLVHSTGSTETPLPPGFSPSTLLDVGTGGFAIRAEAADVVLAAHRYAHALAVLPINAEHEAYVDRLVESRVAGTRVKRPITQRAR